MNTPDEFIQDNETENSDILNQGNSQKDVNNDISDNSSEDRVTHGVEVMELLELGSNIGVLLEQIIENYKKTTH